MIDIALRIARRYAPGLVGRLAGDRAEEVARTVLDLGGLITGTQDPEQIEARLEADPELAHAYRMEAMKIDAELAALDHQNTADARARDARFIEAGQVNRRADVLAYAALIGLIAIVGLILFVSPGDDFVKGVIATVTGVLASAVRDVFNFEFGSSRGSKAKEDQISRLTDRLNGNDRPE